MAILFRSEYNSNASKFDIPIAYKPSGTQPGDFMLMRVITLNDNEPTPVVPGWTLVVHEYLPGISQFIFSRTSDENSDKYTIIRKRTGINYIQIYSFYSDTRNEILFDEQSITIPNTFKRNAKVKFDIADYTMQHNDYEENEYQIKFISGKLSIIELIIYEIENIYQAKLNAPVITQASVNEDNSVTLKWNGTERYTLEMAESEDNWKVISNKLDADTYTVDDLLPGTKYYFRLYATKDNTISQASKAVDIKTYDKIILRSVAYNSASTMNPRIVVSPSGVQRGDLMIMQVNYLPKMKIMKISKGWKLLHEQKSLDVCCNIYYKIATAKEPSSYFVQHNGIKSKKMLLAVAAFYSSSGNLVRIANSAIQYNPSSNWIVFPPVSLEAQYSLGIGLSVRAIESSLRLPIDTTIMWDTDKNLRTTGLFRGYNNLSSIIPDSIYANPGSSIAATIALIEKEVLDIKPPSVPTGLKAKNASGTTIRLS